jgi:hypothetical protein
LTNDYYSVYYGMDAITSVKCLEEKGEISEDQSDSMQKIIPALPSDAVELLKLLVALKLTE